MSRRGITQVSGVLPRQTSCFLSRTIKADDQEFQTVFGLRLTDSMCYKITCLNDHFPRKTASKFVGCMDFLLRKVEYLLHYFMKIFRVQCTESFIKCSPFERKTECVTFYRSRYNVWEDTRSVL